ncbi:MAG: hypothetical protein GEU78_06530 [Actinobacteria bacterium]|nr:hypothetical protein [Actinomycetota bacterium]
MVGLDDRLDARRRGVAAREPLHRLGFVRGRLFLALGLLALFGAGCRQAEAGAPVIAIEIEHSRFDPAAIRVEAGSTVTFVVHNGDPIAHEFLIGDAAAQRRHETGTEPEHGARPGELSIPPGETRITSYTFPSDGRLLVGCHLPRHYDYGMRGTITIR